MKRLLIFLFVSIFGGVAFGDGSVGVEPPSAGWNFGNITQGSVSNSLVLNSLSDNYGISQFHTYGTNGLAEQSLGNNDYIPENGVKNTLALEGYTQAYDYNPSYTGLYASAYTQPLPTNIPLTELSFMGLAGNPNAIQNVYVPTSEYDALSNQSLNSRESIDAIGINNLTNELNVTNDQVNTNTANIGNLASGLNAETNRAQGVENGLQSQINQDERLKVMPEADIRILDTQHQTVALYDSYDATNGRNFATGVRYTLKLGKSWEEKKLDAQAVEIKALEAMVERLSNER